MSEGHPLQDQDRWDWLISLRTACTDVLAGKTPKASSEKPVFEVTQDQVSTSNPPNGVVLTCSALKRKYRDVIRIATYNDPTILVHFVYLHATEEMLLKRVAARQNHYMGADMVHSQFESLEIPTDDEIDVLRIDVGVPKAEVEAEALRKVEEVVHGDAWEGHAC
jgi:gluconokinase